MAANSNSILFKYKGLAEIRSVLKALPEEIQNKVLGVAMKRAAAPLVSAAKAFAPTRTGALRKSISFIVRKGKKGGAYAVVGPASGYYSGGAALGADADKRGAGSPAHYAHLVEYGHHVVAPTKGTSLRKKNAKAAKNGTKWVPAQPFMRPALLASHDAVANELAEGISEGITATLKRIVKNPGARA